MPTEADTCRKFVVPKLQAAGWDNDPHSIAEQRWFTKGRIVLRGNHAERRKGKRADYLLRYTRDFPILEKYAIDGELQFTLPDVLKVAPLWRHGNVAEIIDKFGGVDQLRNAVNQLQTLLYAP
jgi:hypothetical protein